MVWLNIIALAGALQGAVILLSVLFRLRHGKNLSLALLITALSIRLALIPLWHHDVLIRSPWLWPLVLPLSLLFAPIALHHLKETVHGIPKPMPALSKICLPWLTAVLLVSVRIFHFETAAYRQFVNQFYAGNVPSFLLIMNALIFMSNTIYLILSLSVAFGSASRKISAPKRLWMKSLVIMLAFVLLVSAFEQFQQAGLLRMGRTLAGERHEATVLLSLFLSVFIFMISLFLTTLPNVLILSDSIGETRDPEPVEHECRVLIERLEKRMDEGAFRNPDLSLRDMAAEFGVHPNLLSHAVNSYCGLGFRAYLNRKRLAFFEKQLLETGISEHSMLEMAFESGFHSKSTFNRVFHEETGLSPTEYLKQKKKA